MNILKLSSIALVAAIAIFGSANINLDYKNENFLFLSIAFFIFSVVWTLLLGFATPCLLYTSPSPRDATLSRMPSSA